MIKALALVLLSQILASSPFTDAHQLRGATTFIFEGDNENHRDLAATCPSSVSSNYQKGANVIPCTQNSDCAGWTQDGSGCCLYPFCICGAKNAGASSTVSCLADSVTRSEPPSSPLPVVNIGPAPAPARPPTVRPITLKPTLKPTAKPTPKPTAKSTPKPTTKSTPKPTVKSTTKKPTTKPSMRPTVKPTARPTNKITSAPVRKTTAAPQVNRNDTPSPAVIVVTPPQSKTTPSPTKAKTCPSDVSPFYQSVTGAAKIIPCTKNSDCAGWTQDGPGCCLHPFCICGAQNTGSSSVTCLSF